MFTKFLVWLFSPVFVNSKVVPLDNMEAYGGTEVQLNSLLTPALDGDVWSASRPGRIVFGKLLLYPLLRNIVGPQSRSGGFGEDKNPLPLPGLESQTTA
jgi:hypothetical protein